MYQQRRYSSSSSSYNSNSRSGGFRPGFNRGGGARRGRDQKIDASLFTSKAVPPAESVPYAARYKFSDFPVSEQLQKNITAKNYSAPTPIQDQSIMQIIEGRDLVGIANTGTGKTAAFLIPLINKIQNIRHEKVLILVPTRELAEQINEEFHSFTKGLGMQSVVCIGGASINNQIHGLRRNPQFVIGTPGRIKDLNERGELPFEYCDNVVLDEVDRMLDMGFVQEIRQILSKLPKKRQSLFFSATMPPRIKQLVGEFLNDPLTVSVKTRETSQNIEQSAIRVFGKEEKFAKLNSMLQQSEFSRVLVFGKTKWGVEKLTQALTQKGIKADAIHGDKPQAKRQRALQAFKQGKVNVLVATDVAARGLDIDEVSHVINFDQPSTYDDYVHRIGRTGRGGKAGIAITFVD